MFEKYGFMTIKKDSILYMLSKNDEYDNIDEINQIDNLDIIDEESKNKLIEFYKPIKEYPILFCNFHPSESRNICSQSKYIYHIKLKKDIKIPFLIEGLIGKYLLSGLSKIKMCRLSKLYTSPFEIQNMYYFDLSNLILQYNLDGIFIPLINGKKKDFMNVEIGIINNNDLYSIVDVSKYTGIWDFLIEKINNTYCLKHWGKKYKICSIDRPIHLNLHIRYKKLIHLYRKRELESNIWQDLTFQYILKNININYYKCDKNIKIPQLIYNKIKK